MCLTEHTCYATSFACLTYDLTYILQQPLYVWSISPLIIVTVAVRLGQPLWVHGLPLNSCIHLAHPRVEPVQLFDLLQYKLHLSCSDN